jgi:hypothetical protein
MSGLIQTFPAETKLMRLSAATLPLLESKVNAWLSLHALAIEKVLSRDIVPQGFALTAVITYIPYIPYTPNGR